MWEGGEGGSRGGGRAMEGGWKRAGEGVRSGLCRDNDLLGGSPSHLPFETLREESNKKNSSPLLERGTLRLMNKKKKPPESHQDPKVNALNSKAPAPSHRNSVRRSQVPPSNPRWRVARPLARSSDFPELSGGDGAAQIC